MAITFEPEKKWLWNYPWIFFISKLIPLYYLA